MTQRSIFFLWPIVVILMAGCSDKGKQADAVADGARLFFMQESVRFEYSVTRRDPQRREYGRRYSGEMSIEGSHGRIDADEYGTTHELAFMEEDLYVRVEEDWVPLGESDVTIEFDTAPGELFQALRRVESSKSTGKVEEIRGQQAQSYDASVRSEKLFAITGIPFNTSVDELPEFLKAQVWLSAEGLPVRLEFDFTFDSNDQAYAVKAEFWDWNAPELEEVLTLDELIQFLGPLLDQKYGGLAGFENPFEDVPCADGRVDECLDVNPEVQAMAQDPALCDGEAERVCLAPFGNVRADVVQAIVDFHRETKGLDIVVLPSQAIPATWVDPDTSQVTEYALYNTMKATFNIQPNSASTFIGLAPFDLVPESGEYGWFFGARFSRDGAQRDGVFSYFRMQYVEPYDGSPLNDELLYDRVAKYAGRYVAVLFYQYAFGDDINYLNYRDMYGFGDLDGLQPNWPQGESPCTAEVLAICIIGDEDWDSYEFEDSLNVAVERLSEHLSIPVGYRITSGYYPTKPSWSEEFHSDLMRTMRSTAAEQQVIIGVTDDEFAQDTSVDPHVDGSWPSDRIAVVSTHGAGSVGSKAHDERLFRLLLRAVAQTAYGMPLTSDPTSLLCEGVTSPKDLDGLVLPVLP